jgi:hypothetical protein
MKMAGFVVNAADACIGLAYLLYRALFVEDCGMPKSSDTSDALSCMTVAKFTGGLLVVAFGQALAVQINPRKVAARISPLY